MPSKKRLAVLSSRFPYPVEKGDKLRLFHQIIYLSEYFDVYLFSLAEEVISEEWKKELEPYCKMICIYRETSIRRQWRVVRSFLRPWPSQLHYFYSSRIHESFLKDFFKVNPDVIYCQLYRMAPYLTGIEAPKVLDVMDAFGTIAELYGDNAGRFYERWFWNKEHRRILQYEREYIDHFQHFTVISERDAAQLQLPEGSDISVVRNGIDLDYFQSYRTPGKIPVYDMAFIGNMEYPPNIEAVRYIRNRLVPLFEEKKENVRILVGGKGASGLSRNLRSHSMMEFHDWYDDIREAYYSTRIFIAPLFLGSGMQNKVLEAMASNRPVICSSHVIAAMPMLRNYVYIADVPEDYIKAYFDLKFNQFKDKKQKGGLTVLRDELTWESQNERLKKILNDITENYQWNFAGYD